MLMIVGLLNLIWKMEKFWENGLLIPS